MKQIRTKPKTRNLKQSRDEILNAAFGEVFTKGFQGVSVDDIIKKTTLTKGAFYHQFPTKMDLGYALVDEVIRPLIIERWILPLDRYENPLEGILAQMRALIGECDPIRLRFGCPLNNLVQEMAPIDKGFHKRLQTALELWISELDKHLKRGQKNGFLREDVKTIQVAHFVVMAHEGFYGILKGLDDPKIFSALYNSMKQYFRTIQTGPLDWGK